MIETLSHVVVPAWWVVACLYLICAICFAALICKNYYENWLQWIGLSGMILWALGRADKIMDRISDGKENVGLYVFIGVFSMVLYGLGTAWKVWKHRS